MTSKDHLSKEASFDRVKRYSIKERPSKVSTGFFAKVPKKGILFSEFLDNLPEILQVSNLKKLVKNLKASKEKGSPIFWMMGGHVIKVGLAPVLIELIQQGWVQGVFMNSAASIHDSEIARFGQTSEDVTEAIRDGSFGMAEETSVEYLEALKNGVCDDLGWGESIAKWLAMSKMPYEDYSLLASCWNHKIPVTVHGALGTDIIWQHPELDGETIGKAGHRDFKKIVHQLKSLEGGVLLNWGSAVILPEVFLKAFTLVRNLGIDVKKFTTANFDQIQHYRPRVNILERPTSEGGEKFAITGHHEFMMPILAQMLLEE